MRMKNDKEVWENMIAIGSILKWNKSNSEEVPEEVLVQVKDGQASDIQAKNNVHHVPQ